MKLSVNKNFDEASVPSTLGRGHRGLELCSMSLNMKFMTNSAYNFYKYEISKCNAIKVNTCLQEARCEVRKLYSEIDDIQPSKPIEVAVGHDGTWQKREFTSKHGIGSVSYTHLDVYKRQFKVLASSPPAAFLISCMADPE